VNLTQEDDHEHYTERCSKPNNGVYTVQTDVSDTPRVSALLIDDDDVIVSLWTELLKSLGIASVATCDGMKGLDTFMAGDSFDIVVCGVNMPKMNGYAVAQAIRNAGSDVPLIACSGNGSEEVALKSGFDVFVRKPFLIEDFIQAILTAVRKRGKLELNAQLERAYLDSPIPKSSGAAARTR
jgi:CheY-like chemotaxis protein